MRASVLGIWVFILVSLSIIETAHANCEIGGREVACETRNGHYRIRKPEGTGPHPTVLYLYGSTGNSAQKLASDGFVRAFIDRGYAVIVPAGLDLNYVGGIVDSGWFLRNSRAHKQRDDTKFVAEVLADAEVRHRIDRKRVLIAGMSNGGFLTWEIACHSPELAAAFAPVAAGYLGKMPKRCKRAVRMLHTHGRSDRIVPLDPDQAWRSGGVKMMPLGAALERIGQAGGCTSRGDAKPFKEYDRSQWQGCGRGASVDVLVHNGGHTIPLSWYSTVIDWFEKGSPAMNRTTSGGGTARFLGTDSRDNSRFKKPKFTTE